MKSLLLSTRGLDTRLPHTRPLHHDFDYYADTWKPNVNECVSVVAACKHSALCSTDYGDDYSCRVWSRGDENRSSWFQSPDSGVGGGKAIFLLLLLWYWLINNEGEFAKNNVFKSPKFTRTHRKNVLRSAGPAQEAASLTQLLSSKKPTCLWQREINPERSPFAFSKTSEVVMSDVTVLQVWCDVLQYQKLIHPQSEVHVSFTSRRCFCGFEWFF